MLTAKQTADYVSKNCHDTDPEDECTEDGENEDAEEDGENEGAENGS